MANLLPKHLASVPHLAALDKVAENLSNQVNMAPLMCYMIDTVSSVALPFLASQFEMINFRDYQLAASDDDRRAILKQAVSKRASMGTVAAVRHAIALNGFDPSYLVERTDEGLYPGGWATFSVEVPGGYSPIPAGPGLALFDLILQVKPACCKWLGVVYTIDGFSEAFPIPTETVSMAASYTMTDAMPLAGFKYNGQHKHNGAMKHKPGVEDVQIHIV